MTVSINGSTGITTPAIDLAAPLSVADGGTGTTRAYTLESATAVSASGVLVDFTGIPSWAKRVTVMFDGVSTNSTSPIILRLGTSGGVVSTGYVGVTSNVLAASANSASKTTGFELGIGGASDINSGSITFTKLSSDVWTCFGAVSQTTATLFSSILVGSVSLGAVLDKVRITTVGGTAVFEAGSINIMYEG